MGKVAVMEYDQVLYIKEAVENMISTYTGLELEKKIEDLVEQNPEAGVLMGLLLPAIQKIERKANNSYLGLTTIVEGTLITPERIAWDKEVRRGATLAALDLMLSPDFDNYDEAHASIPLQEAMHHAACVWTWNKIYELHNN